MKYLSIIRYVLLAVSALITVLFFALLPDKSQQMEFWGTDAILNWTYLLCGLAIALIIIMPLINVFKNPKGAMRSLVGLVIVVGVGIVAYVLGDPSPVPNSAGGFFETPWVNKISDAGIYLTYTALAATIVVAVLGEIRNAFK